MFNTTIRSLLVFMFVSVVAPRLLAQLTPLTGTTNSIAAAVTAINSGGTTLTVGSSAGFAPCDEVLLIQMAGASITTTNDVNFGNVTSYGQAGAYEFAIVASVNATEIVLTSPLGRTYVPGAANGLQVIKVTRLNDALVTGTLTAPVWNGTTGGVLVLDIADTLRIDGIIDMVGKGFRGGVKSNAAPSSPGPQLSCGNSIFGWPSVRDASDEYLYSSTQNYSVAIPGSGTFNNTGDYWGGQKGEGLAERLVAYDRGRGKLANGGGGGNNTQTGGGGGSNAGAGGVGGWSSNGCQGTVSFRFGGEGGASMSARYTPSFNVLMMGGGGGGPHFKGPTPTVPGTGGNGGGIIIIKAGTLLGTGGIIRADGAMGGKGDYSGAGGGGGGGSILIAATNYAASASLTLSANGGAGGNTEHGGTNRMGPGGGGGGGSILYANTAVTPTGHTVSTAAGAAGLLIDRTPNETWNNTPGTAGIVGYNYTLPGNFGNAAPATPTVVGNQTVCTGQSTTLTASGSFGATYRWFDSGGSVVFSGNPFVTPAISVATTYRVKAYFGSCDSSVATTVNITVGGASLAAPTALSQSICSGQTVTLTATPPTGADVEWFDAPTGGNALGTGTSLVRGPLFAATTFYAESFQGGCRSASRTAVAVSVTAVTASILPATAQSICAGQSVTLTGPTLSGLSYQWLLNGNPVAGGTGVSYPATQAGSYELVVSQGGCVDTSTAVTVTVQTVPATISPSTAQSICAGQSVTLSGPTGAGLSYQWLRNGNLIPGANNATYDASQLGSYTVTVTQGSCSATSAPVTVGITTVTANIAPAGPLTLCSGQSVQLTSASGGGSNYQWMLNGVPISGATANVYNATQAGNYSVVVAVNGCSDTSATVVVNVTSVVASISPMVPQSICAGQSVTLNGPSGAGQSYQWLLNGTPIGGATNSTYDAAQAGSYAVVVTENGCTDTSVSVLVSQTTVAASITPNTTQSICAGQSVTFTGPSGVGLTYQWLLDGSPISGATGSTFTATQAGDYTVSVTQNGCTATPAAVTVTVNSVSAAVTPSTPQSICVGQTVSLSGPAGAGLTYQWLRNGTPVPGATSATFDASQAGNYAVVVTQNGCSGQSAAVTVSVFTQSNLGLLPQVDTLDFYLNGPSVTLSTDPGFVNYRWWIAPVGGSQQTLTGSTSQLSFNGNTLPLGLYYVWVEAQSGNCTLSSDSLLVRVDALPSGVDARNDARWTLSPNPVINGLLTIRADQSAGFEVLVYDATGRLVAQQTASGPIGQLLVADWPSGVYLIKCREALSGAMGTYRIVKP